MEKERIMAGTTHEIKDRTILEELKQNARTAALELMHAAHLHAGNIVVIGCSTSETLGEMLGTWSAPEAGAAIYEGLQDVFLKEGIYIAAQCCEHLNRALIIEAEAVPGAEYVNVVPQPKAGGSFATACYYNMKRPVALEHIKADAGLDIGGTLIGMHLKNVAVPIRLKQHFIGKAYVTAARVRPKFIGGERAAYDEALKNGYFYVKQNEKE